jgi:putative cell wall-binding protein
LLVADGDTVEAVYEEASFGTGIQSPVTFKTHWVAGSSKPDFRELTYSTAATTGPTVFGGPQAVGANTEVRVYASQTAATPVAEGISGPDGDFAVSLPPTAAAASLWVTAKEASNPESARVAVAHALATGRVLVPDTKAPVSSALVSLRRLDGTAGGSGGITNHGGRFAVTTGITPGEYSLTIEGQGGYGDQSTYAGSEWDNDQSYGAPPLRQVTVPDMPQTVDLGDIEMLAPTFFARVVGGGTPVPGAVATTTTTAGEFIPAASYSRPDGRFALYLPDGDFRVRVQPPPTCPIYPERTVEVSVRDGVATPNHVTIEFGAPTATPPAVPVPVPTGVGDVFMELLTSSGVVSLTLQSPGGRGDLGVLCRGLDAPPDGVVVVDPGVELDAPTLSFPAAEVCLTYDDERLAASGLAESAVELLHRGDDGAVTRITTVRDPAVNRVCGLTDSFSSFAVGNGEPPTSPPTPAPTTLSRIAGEDRIATAVAVSKAAFPSADAADVVVLAHAYTYADALAGVPLAVQRRGPLLLTPESDLDPRVAGEVDRVLREGAILYILGGVHAIDASIDADLRGRGYDVRRLAGADRYETAVAIVDQGLGRPARVFEASGLDFPDALAAGAAAAMQGAGVLLTAGVTQSPATGRYLAAFQPARFAVGGPAAAADPDATALVGGDRYETATLVAAFAASTATTIGIASGVSFPDALAGGAHAGSSAAPVLLVPPAGSLPTAVTGYLGEHAAAIDTVIVYGGPSAVPDEVASAVRDATD